MAANAMNDAISTNPDSPATANLQWFNGINDVAGLHQKESFITARVFVTNHIQSFSSQRLQEMWKADVRRRIQFDLSDANDQEFFLCHGHWPNQELSMPIMRFTAFALQRSILRDRNTEEIPFDQAPEHADASVRQLLNGSLRTTHATKKRPQTKNRFLR